ncbi:hypothetical protein BV20DRAFT_973315 [Pilatotrama ljubarskyi]|nr:hypothetical protein BV20DRAFT_973315 [Pilatotrama ljubarskyi]
MFPSIPLFAVVSAPFKRAQLGLFQGKTKQYGNNVPNSKHKTRRTWLPNVHNQRLFSDALQQYVRLKVSARALKTIKKVCTHLVAAVRVAVTNACCSCSTGTSTNTC